MMVSVCMITYNHEKFIEQAIKMIVEQKTNFEYELVIGEDCSTDNTKEIIESYRIKYPSILKSKYNETNIGMMQNFIETLNRCTGKYIALCEGDDYWTDMSKLQCQVDVLERYENISTVVTNATKVDLSGNLIEKFGFKVVKDNMEGAYNLHHFFKFAHKYPTASVLFRNFGSELLEGLKYLANPYFGDWTLWILLHLKGDVYYLNEDTASYRINPSSVTHSVNAVNRWEYDIEYRKKMKLIIPKMYKRYLNSDWYAYLRIAIVLRKQKKYFKATYYFFISFINNPFLFFNEVLSISKLYY